MSNENEHVEQHKKIFNQFLLQAKENCKLISRYDVEKAELYLKSRSTGESVEISIQLKRRIQNNNFCLASFPSSNDVLCVKLKEKKSKGEKGSRCRTVSPTFLARGNLLVCVSSIEFFRIILEDLSINPCNIYYRETSTLKN